MLSLIKKETRICSAHKLLDWGYSLDACFLICDVYEKVLNKLIINVIFSFQAIAERPKADFSTLYYFSG